jgi:hypothetical protein
MKAIGSQIGLFLFSVKRAGYIGYKIEDNCPKVDIG